MRDNLSIFVTMIVLVILVVIFPLYNHFERQDNMSYNLVLKATTNFVDQIINSGYIDQDMYTKYVSQIANTGNLYDIQLEAHKKIITSDTEIADAYKDQYIVDYNDDIFEASTGQAKDNGLLDDKSIKNGIYKLDTGDEIYIKVKNSSTTMAEAIFKTIVPLASSKNITVNYGGIIKNNAWVKAESGVIAKELITLKFKVGADLYDDIVEPQYLYNGDNFVTFDITEANSKLSPEHYTGWYDEDDESKKLYTENTVKVKKSIVFVAKNKNSIVELNSNGGILDPDVLTKFEVKDGDITYEDAYGSNLPTPTKTGYTFDGWYTEINGGDKITDDSNISSTSDHTLYAHWTGKTVKVNFNSNEGTLTGPSSTNVIYGEKYGNVSNPTRTGYIFDGWYTELTAGDKITSATTVSKENEHTLYAHWSVKKITVTFNNMDKTSSSSSTTTTKEYNFNGTYQGYPTPTRANCSFDGWYTAASGGTKITNETTIDNLNNHTLYAHWKANNNYVITKIDASNNYFIYQGYKGSVNISVNTTNKVPDNTVYNKKGELVVDGKTVYRIADNDYILKDACQEN